MTVADLLAFARTHLAGGVAPTGQRVLSKELTARMQTVTVDMGLPNVSPIGLGWPLLPFGDTPVLVHSGASPGGIAVLLVVPEHDLAFAAFGNSGAAMAVHDRLCLWMLREHLGIEGREGVRAPIEPRDLHRHAGTYRSNQLRVDVKLVDGHLEETTTFEPFDEAHARILTAFSGGQFAMPPQRLVPVGDRLFAPAALPLEALSGFGQRMLVAFLGGEGGRPAYRVFAGRMTRRSGAG